MDKAHFYREALAATTGPLETTRVVDCTTAWAGPMAGCLLADLGDRGRQLLGGNRHRLHVLGRLGRSDRHRVRELMGAARGVVERLRRALQLAGRPCHGLDDGADHLFEIVGEPLRLLAARMGCVLDGALLLGLDVRVLCALGRGRLGALPLGPAGRPGPGSSA